MALASLVSQWSRGECHILTVDHGLRPEAKDETRMVDAFAKSIGVKSKIFKWIGDKPDKSIQEAARTARYEMMGEYCQKKKIEYLFLAHHADDQRETFLHRLAKGSGIDGLSCMKEKSSFNQHLTLLRPLLSVTHDDLVNYCKTHHITWAEDPSNGSEKYMRGRLRGSVGILEREGLTAPRITKLTKRLESLNSFVNEQIDLKEKKLTKLKNTQRIEIAASPLASEHTEVVTRLISRALSHFFPDKPYPARLEDIERLSARLKNIDTFRGATLGGLKFAVQKKNDMLLISKEK